MRKTLLTLSLVVLLPAPLPADSKDKRKPNPFAPSLPQLTDEEEEEIDNIIDRFIRADIGRLPNPGMKKALADLQKLGPEAIPGLIRGLNRAAKLEASCPALTIGKKLESMLHKSNDPELLDFARENIGAGVTRSNHMGLLRDLRVVCLVRKRAALEYSRLATTRGSQGTPSQKSPRLMSVSELANAVKTERGALRRVLMSELADRRGDEVIDTLASAAASKDGEEGPLGRTLLARHLSRLSARELADKLKDERPEIRAAVARAVGAKGLRLGDELINLLTDSNAEVRKAARQALVKLSRGADFGPKDDASEDERSEAVKKWQAWWAKQGGR